MKTHRQTSFLRYTKDGVRETDESIVVESFLELWLEDMHLTSFVCTPGNERELCLGFLVTSGIVSNAADVEFSEVSNSQCVITSKRKSSLIQSFLMTKTRAKDGIAPLNTELISERPVDLATLVDAVNRLRSSQQLHSETGAAHGAMMVHLESQEFIMIEDIGRHNAVDKVVGYFAAKNIEPSQCMLLVTGRLTSEMVSKAGYARIPFMGSLAFATDFGIQIASNVGITLLGSLKREEFWIYNQGTVMPFQY
ncbi:MAG: formate dehydrogenase accessory sulfurtransferase FdhD [Candidatus Thorarchaeota archaeon]|jgi:FdhD protein